MDTSFGRQFFDRQIEFLTRRDVDALVEQQYDPDAILVGFGVTIRGREALREYFKGYLERLGSLTLKSLDNYTEIEDAIFFDGTVEVDQGRVKVYDIFIFKDGKAIRHFTGVISFEPKPAA